ncbi:MAG TPA: 2-dehydropantoate 2-reductase [Chthoniobacter sp.]|jgi:2-dehydropantoate 2-reductase
MNAVPQSMAVIGAGALGSYYGAKLARQGADVRFLMRADLEVVRRARLRIREQGTEWVVPAQAFGSTEEIGPVDLVIIGLKTTANEDLDRLIPPLLHEGTLLLTLQNGLGNEEYLAERWGVERVLGGLCFVCLNRVAPGVIEHYGHGTLSLGEFRRASMERTKAIGAMFSTAGVETHVVENLITERWRKLVWNIPFNGLSIAAGGRTCDLLLADAGMKAQLRALMLETIAAAEALGESIPESFADYQIERTYAMGPYKPSSMIDWQLGRAVEVESIWGEPWRQGNAAGAALPRLELLYNLLRQVTRR